MPRLSAISAAILLMHAVFAPSPAQAQDKPPPARPDDDVGRLLRSLAPVPLLHAYPVTSMIFAADGRTVTTVSDFPGRLTVWDAYSGKRLREWRLPQHVIARSVLSADGKVLAVSDGIGGTSLWEVAAGKQLRVVSGTHGHCLGLSPDGKSLVTGLFEGGLGVWDVATGKLRGRLPKSSWSTSSNIAFSPDGKRVAAARTDGGIGVWDTADGKELHSLPAASTDPQLLTFTPNGKGLAASDRTGAVRVWDLASARERRAVQMPAGYRVTCGMFMPDGRTLLTGGADGTVRLWEMASGKERHRFPGQSASINVAALTGDGRAVAIMARDHQALVREVGGHTRGDYDFAAPPRPKDLDAAWADLADHDTAKAYRAAGVFVEQGTQAIAFLRKRLAPATTPDPKELSRLVAELDSPVYSRRERAMKELEALHESAAPALEAALKQSPALEVRRRLQQLLDRTKQAPPLERLRALRAVEALETMATKEARALIEILAAGSAGEALTEDARAALERLKNPTPMPR
jgi:WD domain, G-beta repeat